MKKFSNNKVFNTKVQEYIRDYRDKDINLIKKEVQILHIFYSKKNYLKN